MPDIISVISRQWKLILVLTVTATALAYIGTLVSPKLYVGVATALPINTLVNDKSRIFSNSIEGLYSEIGTPDELDKIEGTTKLDTIYIATATDFNLPGHYQLDTTRSDYFEKAVLKLRKTSNISRTGFGELQVKVWDRDNVMAAALANSLMEKLNGLHKRMQMENSRATLQILRDEFAAKLQDRDSIDTDHSSANKSGVDTVYTSQPAKARRIAKEFATDALNQQLQEYQKLIYQYELAVKTNANVLTIVEHARPSPWADKPKTAQTVVLVFFASLLFSFLLALFIESRKIKTW